MATHFPEKRNALVFVLGIDPVDEVEPFAPLDRPFRISQLVLVSCPEQTHARMAGWVAVPPAAGGDVLLEVGDLPHRFSRLAGSAL